MPQISWEPTLLCEGNMCSNYLSGAPVAPDDIDTEKERLLDAAVHADWCIEADVALCPQCMEKAK